MTTFEPGASDVFTHGLDLQPALDRVAREQAGADHHRRVRRVRARRDRGDHDVAVVELGLGAVGERQRDDRRRRGRRPARRRCRRRAPARRRRSCAESPFVAGGSEAGNDSSDRSSASVCGGSTQVLEREPERRLGLGQRDAVLRALRAGERRHDLAEVELERLGVGRLLGVLVVPQALRLGVGLDALDDARRERPENSR